MTNAFTTTVGGGWTVPAKPATPDTTPGLLVTDVPDVPVPAHLTPPVNVELSALHMPHVPAPVVDAVAPVIEQAIHKLAQDLADTITGHLLNLFRGLK